MGFWDSFFEKSADSNVTNIKAFIKENNFVKKPDFTEEFASDIFNDRISNNSDDSYSENGVSFEDKEGSLRLVYNGILAKSGAENIYAVVGHGDSKNWEDTKYYPMNTSGYQTYELLLPVKDAKGVNIAFKDGANNWDNNSGANYRLM